MAMAEEQASHRRSLETQVVTAGLRRANRGQILGFIIGITAIVGGIYLIAIGKDGYGFASIVASLASLTGVFIYRAKQETTERKEKRADFASPQLQLPYDGTERED